ARKAVPSLVEKGMDLAREGKISESLAAYAEAKKLDPAVRISAGSLNDLCWNGSLAGQAAEVLESCQQAVSLDPQNGEIRDSRGLARALTGDSTGAIEDFKFFVDWTEKDQQSERTRSRGQQRERWVAELQAGRNPFDAATLEALRKQ